MKTRIMMLILTAAIFVAGTTAALERSEVDEMYKWKTTDLYPDEATFKQELVKIVPDAEKLAGYKGKLGDSAAAFKEALDLYYGIERRLRRMGSYTSRMQDQDTRVSKYKALRGEFESVRTKFAELSAYMEPEIIGIDEKKLKKFFEKEPVLKVYAFPISETLRRKKHILPPDQEGILAAVNDIAYDPESTYSIFTDADMPKSLITLEDGTQVKLSYDAFDRIRRSYVEADRKKAFEAFFGSYSDYKRTLAQTLYTQLKTYKFFSKVRGYDSNLEVPLDYNGIDPQIYHSLIEAAHKNLDTFHRYLKLKARVLGKEHLDYTDLYLPFSKEVKIEVSYEEAQKMLIDAFAPLGEEYVNTVSEAFSTGWIDVYPAEGKRSGAYSSGWAYDVHPFVLMNYNDTYSDALTLAHEMGHAMHSYFSNSNQPFPTSDYSTFVAEVASTFNENLVMDRMLKNVKSDEERLYLLGNWLDASVKGTFFRQIQFAEFELMMHQMVEKGEALTDEVLNKMYLDLTRTYYGHDQGVVNVPELIAVEWAIVPHFYYNFYVFQYSTSIAAASHISQRVIGEEPGALEAYYDNLLKAGGRENTVDLLKKAGADLTAVDAYNALMERANRYMDEVEKILDAKGM